MATDLPTTLTFVNGAFFGVLGLLFAAFPVSAHKLLCAPHDAFLEANEKLGFVPQGIGVTDNGFLAEAFVNPETGEWIWISTNPAKLSCIINSGDGWKPVKVLPGEAS